MNPPLPSQTKFATGEDCGTSAMICGGQQQPACAPYAASLLGFLPAAAALLTFVMVCAALLLMRRPAHGSAIGPDSTARQGSNLKMDGVGEDVAWQIRGATLVLFPGEQKPRTLAVPSQLQYTLPLQPADQVPQIIISVDHLPPPMAS